MTIIGGAYREVCLNPRWNCLRGSGVRSAAAISKLVAEVPNTGVELKTWASEKDQKELGKFCKACEFPITIYPRSQQIEWQYDHSLSIPRLYPAQKDIAKAPVRSFNYEKVLVFSTIECSPQVTAEQLVYDPQGGSNSIPFSKSGHRAGKTALVANFQEICAMADSLHLRYSKSRNVGISAARALLKSERLDVVVVKSGTHGADVVSKDGHQHTDSHPTRSVFPIGSGDVFSAVFAAHWLEMGRNANDAAHWASVGAAVYCNSGGRVPLPANLLAEEETLKRELLDPKTSARRRGRPQVYLAGPLFTLPQLWFLGEITRYLEHWGAKVFSPWRDVGLLADIKDSRKVASADLEGLKRSHSVLAIVDGCDAGTLFEIGYAVAQNIPVVAFGERVSGPDITMLEGTGCEVHRDFATAVYRAGWLAGAR
jgi:nucleoside 2-deoxyribosyltransferase